MTNENNIDTEKLQGRIIKGIGGLYFVATDKGTYCCSIRGIFRKRKITPYIGDNVIISVNCSGDKGNIEEIQPRKNMLIRPRVANVDQAVIVFSKARPQINLDLLDRLILIIEEQKLQIVICINKADLDGGERLEDITGMYESAGFTVIQTNTVTGGGVDRLMEHLAGKVSVFAGPSGVGKSSIVNALVPKANMEVGGLSAKIDRGKHTTRHVELIELFKDSYITDSPGFSSISLEHVKRDSLAGLFREFNKHSDKCRFLDCKHINEPDCAVKNEVGNSINQVRYNRYVSIYNELES